MSLDDLKKLAQADQKDIKAIKGNANDARNFFNAKVDKSTINEVKLGVFVGKDSNGVTFTYRSKSTYGKQDPTININGINGIRKIKLTE